MMGTHDVRHHTVKKNLETTLARLPAELKPVINPDYISTYKYILFLCSGDLLGRNVLCESCKWPSRGHTAMSKYIFFHLQ